VTLKRSIALEINGISSYRNRTNFHEWGAASPENFFVGFIRVYLRTSWFKYAALGQGGRARETSAFQGKEKPGSHRQPLQEMISSWLGVTGVHAEEMTKSRKN
jgi:hypothetical protein